MAEYRLAVLASGNGSNLQALIDKVHLTGLARISIVISDRSKAPALARAEHASIPCRLLTPLPAEGGKSYHRRVASVLATAAPDLIVLAGYLRLLPAEFLALAPPVINVHPSLLPAFTGLDAPAQALAAGVKISGCTVHLVDGGMDTGPIICQRALPVLAADTPDSLHARIKKLEHQALIEVVSAFARGRVAISGRKVEIQEEG